MRLERGRVGGGEMADAAARRAQDQRAHAEDAIEDLIRLRHLAEEPVHRRVELLVAVVVAVVADRVALVVDAPQDLRMRLRLHARDVERRLDARLLEHVEHRRCILVIGAVVERQVRDLALAVRHELRQRHRESLRLPLRERVRVVDRHIRRRELQIREIVRRQHARGLLCRRALRVLLRRAVSRVVSRTRGRSAACCRYEQNAKEQPGQPSFPHHTAFPSFPATPAAHAECASPDVCRAARSSAISRA